MLEHIIGHFLNSRTFKITEMKFITYNILSLLDLRIIRNQGILEPALKTGTLVSRKKIKGGLWVIMVFTV